MRVLMLLVVGLTGPLVLSKTSSEKKKVAVIVIPVILVGVILGGLIFWMMWKKLRKQVKATDNFSNNNKLGQGGFGPVYKGTLPEGQEIAVKRLSKSSGQGLEEFKNEVGLIAKLQHRNLVRLLGFSIQGDEKIGYMPPEYAVDGLFSIKSDVFSFGVLVLEIISGKKNRGFFHPDHSHNLLGHSCQFFGFGILLSSQ
ncbi:Serine-threonine/tyrosine-protein kinase [Theobroma cacao]|nr:Serine-threonine/tyrosine-protein kinase [Theobroma cacao]